MIGNSPTQRSPSASLPPSLRSYGEASREGNRWKIFFGAAVIILATFAAYSPTLTASLIWDDDFHFASNPQMQGLRGLLEIWTSRSGMYYPLTLTSFWFLNKIFGFHPLPYHLINILLHVANSLLLWRLLSRLGIRGAWMAAALFALHPVQVESVAWITELKNTQSGFFFLVSLLCAERSGLLDGKPPDSRWMAAAMLAFVAALLSKTSTVMLPAVLLLLLWWRGHLSLPSLRPLVPLFVFSAVAAGWTIIEQRYNSGATGFEWSHGIGFRAALAGHTLWFYLFKLAWPHPLIFFYPKWDFDPSSFSAYLPLLTLAGLFAILWAMRRNWAHAAVLALLCFVLMLFPVMGFFNVYFMRYAYAADHFQYLACISLFALVAAGLSNFRPLSSVLCPPLLIILAFLTFQHAHAFHDERTLWLDTLEKNPGAWMVHNNLGASLQGEGNIDGALEHYQLAVQYNPDHYEALSNLANILAGRNDLEHAIFFYERALRLRPDFPLVHVNLGLAHEKNGQPDQALKNYQDAIAWNPGFLEAWVKLASLHERQGRLFDAVAAWKQALKLRQATPQAASDFFYRHAYELMTNGNSAAAQVYMGEVKKIESAP